MYERELEVAEHAARLAADMILAHYARGDVAVDLKADATPVTVADRDANIAIVDALQDAFPADAILSEELPAAADRLAHRRIWIVDPLDGTRDFVHRTGEFAVHVGLAVDGVAVLGVVRVPVADCAYVAIAGGGAWRVTDAGRERINVSSIAELAAARVGVSRLNPSARLAPFLARTGLAARTIGMGASVKLMALAEGRLDAVINAGSGEHEWDTCAPEVILREAGGVITDLDGAELRYNQPSLVHLRGSLATNRACHAALLEAIREHLRA